MDFVVYICPIMKFIKEAFFGIISCICSLFLIYQSYKFRTGMYLGDVFVKADEQSIQPTLVAGGIKIGIVSTFLPFVFLIVHFILKGNRKVSWIAGMLILCVLFSVIYTYYSIIKDVI